MRPVLVLIFHAEAAAVAGPLVRSLAQARHSLAKRQRDQWLAAGADDVKIVSGPPDGLTFGERLGAELRALPGVGPEGLIVLGSGSMPLARIPDLRRFVEVASGPGGHALANNRYSADVVALSRAADLTGLPPLPSDNALPRWLEERAGVMVTDLRRRWRLGVDVDTPLDLLVLSNAGALSVAATGHSVSEIARRAPLIGERLAALGDILRNPRAELLVAGRVSAATLRWLEAGVACRVRALVEERGLRAASRLAQSDAKDLHAREPLARTLRPPQSPQPIRPPRSVLGDLLDRDGPESLARHVVQLADAAVIDTRVLMAHRLGSVESAWPAPEDRFASDLLDATSVADPWFSALTVSAAAAPSDHPILLGGHTLVNGGLRLLAQRARAVAR
jgi:hypothetical protein